MLRKVTGVEEMRFLRPVTGLELLVIKGDEDVREILEVLAGIRN
jgi:hypothetical protein